MKVVGLIDAKGNFIFEVKSKRVLINAAKLKKLTKCDIPVFNFNSLFNRGLAYGGEGHGSIYLNFKKLVKPRHLNSTIQREVTKVLAHEVKHVLQPLPLRRRSRLLKFFEAISLTRLLPIIIIGGVALSGTVVGLFIEFPMILDLTFCGIFSVTSLWLIIRTIFYHYFDLYEKDARKFAKEVVEQKCWLDVVQVEDLKE